MLSVLTDPNGFFASRVEDPQSLRAATVVLAVSVIGALSGYLVIQRLFSGLPQDVAFAGTIATIFAVGGALVAPFFLWGLYSAVFYVFSLAFDPGGSFKTLAAFTAWGFLPSIINELIGLVLVYVVLGQVQVPTTAEGAAGFQARLVQHSLYRLSIAIGIVFSLWRGFIWTFAVKHARSLSLRESAIVVGIPVAISILFTVVTSFL